MKIKFRDSVRLWSVFKRYPPLILFPLAITIFFLSAIVLVFTISFGNVKSYASGSVSQTVSWTAAQFRQQVCLAGTTICQPFKTTSTNTASWTFPTGVYFDLHVQISDGISWYGWENQNRAIINCPNGAANCTKTFTWAQVDYMVNTTIDNTDHKVTSPTTSYTYSAAPAGFSYTGTVKFRDFDNFGGLHTIQNLSGKTSSWALNPAVVSGNSVTFNFSPASSGNAVAIHVINVPDNGVAAWDSGPINSGSTIVWNGAPSGNYSASLIYGMTTLAGPVNFSVAVTGGTPVVMNPVTTSCNSSTGLANINFNWKLATAPVGYTIDIQKFQIGYAPGNYVARPLSPSTSTMTASFNPNATLYWQVLAHVANTGVPGTILTPPSPAKFTTPNCAPLTPTNLSAGALPTCSDIPYTVIFSWTNSGTSWYVDVSTSSVFSQYSNKSVGTAVSTIAPDGFNPVLTFMPGVTYYWRVYNGVVETNGPSFLVKNCTTGGGGTGGSHTQTDIKNYLHNNTKFGQIITSANCNGGSRGNCANGPTASIGQILYGIAGGESGWNETSVGGKCPSGSCYGLLQYDLPVFNNYVAKLSATTGKTYSWSNAYDQLEIAYYQIMLDPTATAYQLSTQWYPDCVNYPGTSLLYWQYNSSGY